ncbi:MAG: ABC transporter ATP-binding protein [Rhodospirillaceae bacterium]|nr:ABC transporter ATP-binding protein [Rhodospirillaceae bacterium]
MVGSDARPALGGYSATVAQGKLLALVAPDGNACRSIADAMSGFERPRHGRILIDGKDVALRRPGERGVMSVRTELALFPHFSAFANIAFPLEQRRLDVNEIGRRVEQVAADVGIPHEALAKLPAALSPEIRLRVALARALVAEPEVLILERPLNALPLPLRRSLLPELRRLQRRFAITTLLVSDDLGEAMTLSDSMSVVIDGSEVQSGSADQIYARPVSVAIARLAGPCNLIPVDVDTRDGKTVLIGTALRGGTAALPRERTPIGIESGPALMLVRPLAVRLFLGIRRFDILVDGTIADVMPEANGARIRVTPESFPQDLLADIPLPAPTPLEPGRAVTLGWNRGDIFLLPVTG